MDNPPLFVKEAVSCLQTPDRAWQLFCEVSQLVTSTAPGDFLKLVPSNACALLSTPICILWKLDRQTDKFKIIDTAGVVDEQFKQLELGLNDRGVLQLLTHRGAAVLPNVIESPLYAHHAEATSAGWASLLCAPLRVGNDLVGLLDVYTYIKRDFAVWEKNLFTAFACLAADSLQKGDILQETQDKLKGNQKLEQLTNMMLKMTEANRTEDLLSQLLKDSLSLVNQARGCVTRTDYKTGEQVIVCSTEKKAENHRLGFGKGIIGQALATERPVRVGDVRKNRNYDMFWQDTTSELAIPILISNARALVGRKIQLKPKLIGVLNLESPQPDTFSEEDENSLWALARYAALILERIEFDNRLEELRQIEKRIAGNRDFDQTVQLVIEGIIDTLDYEFVNISLVVHEENIVETRYVAGLSPTDAEEFKRMARHSLDSEDIQASIVKSRAIEVPDINDTRFDPFIARRFNHDHLARVFIPMIGPASNQVIGTVQACYQRQYRPYIYDKDIQILKGFVEHAVNSLEQSKPGLIERFIHEMKSPIVGIRSHASLLQRRREMLPDDLVTNAFEDILTDCEVLLQQVRKLGLFLGHASVSSGKLEEVEETIVFKDIVIKTIKQIKPLVKERGFDLSKISYRWSDSTRVIVWVNKAKISQVVFNLLVNAIKYAEDDGEQFKLSVKVDEDEKNFILKFADWGIGVRKGMEEKIFEWGFRAPEVIDKNVSGTGLGLTIAREVIREVGGDLKLTRNRKPTEFCIILPKKLQEAPQ